MSGHGIQNNPPGLNENDRDQIWGDLKEGIEEVFNGQCMPKKRFCELYTYPFQVFCVIDTAYYSLNCSRMVFM
jgi:cullin 1